jgi:hypothetical protein
MLTRQEEAMKRKEDKTWRLGLRVSQEQHKKVDDLAKALDISASDVVRRMVERATLAGLRLEADYIPLGPGPARGHLVELRESAPSVPPMTATVLGSPSMVELQAQMARLQATVDKLGGGDAEQ